MGMFKGPKPPGQARTIRTVAEQVNDAANFRPNAVPPLPTGTQAPAPSFSPRERGAEPTPFVARGGK